MDWKTWLTKWLFPPVWVIVLLSIFSAGAVIAVFVLGWETAWPAYLVYVVAFYTLTVAVLYCYLVLPKQYRRIRQKLYDNPIGRRYLTEPSFRTHVSLFATLTVNLLYVGLNILFYILYHSVWFAFLAMYHAILSVMRYILVQYVRLKKIGTDRRGELIRSLACGWILLVVNLFLTGAVIMMVYMGRGYAYPGLLIYVVASYTFYITTHAIINMIKYRKYNSPVMQTAKTISVAASLVSMLNLETAMLTEFGSDMELQYRQLMIILTGAGVAVIVVVMALLGITGSIRELKKTKKENSYGTE